MPEVVLEESEKLDGTIVQTVRLEGGAEIVREIFPSDIDPLVAGMIWWNALDKAQRKHWMEVAGNTGRAVDAWRAFRSQASVKGGADQ